MELPASFWAKCNLSGPDECWNWTAAVRLNRSGMPYGHYRMGGKSYRSHRLAFSSINGEIPEKMLIRHSCDNTLCTNPKHLLIGSDKDNSDDKYERKREKNPQGISHGMAVLSEDDVIKIRNMRKSGMIYRKIGEELGISLHLAWKAVNKNWKHL